MNKLHWFCFTYIGSNAKGETCTFSSYTGYPDKKITLGRIDANRDKGGLTNAPLTNACYLGYMTEEEFTK